MSSKTPTVLKKVPQVSEVWKTSKGKILLIRDMSTDHIANAIRLWQAKESSRIDEELQMHSECFVDVMDGFPFPGETDPHANLMQYCPLYRGLVKEAESRGYMVESIDDEEARKVLRDRNKRLKKENAEND